MKKRIILLLGFYLFTFSPFHLLVAQDMAHYKRVVKELASAKYQGRGYAKGGANKAGKFLEKEYKKAGVDEVTLQPFTLDIQTFAGKMEMEIASPPRKARRKSTPLRGEERKMVNGRGFALA